MSVVEDFELKFQWTGRQSRAQVSVFQDEALLYADGIDVGKAGDRRRFAEALAEECKGFEIEDVEHQLLVGMQKRLNLKREAQPGEVDHRRESSDGHQRKALPSVVLPGGNTTISEAAGRLGELLASNGEHYVKGGTVVSVETDEQYGRAIRVDKAAGMASQFEKVAKLVRLDSQSGSIEPTICTEPTARLILEAERFLTQLPVIKVVSPCPVLAKRGQRLVQVVGYDRDTGILAGGQEVPEISVDEAVQRLDLLVSDFMFATPSDRARALAAVLTPGLIFGGLLPGRAALDLGEADQSQAGKGFRNKITAAVYGQQVKTVTRRTRGVGGLEESFDAALVGGANFIALDNLRGQIDSPGLESFLTEDCYHARIPYQRPMEIDPRRVAVMLTSNRAEITPDLANRSSCVRLIKRPAGYDFARFPEGDLLDHVRANAGLYLAAVFAVIRAWHEAGGMQSNEACHDFRPWARTLDWIVQNLLGAGPLLEGHREVQTRMANSALTWLRDLVQLVDRAGSLGRLLRAHDLLDLLIDAGEPAVPGVPEDADLAEGAMRDKALMGLGRQLARCFRDGDQVEIDGVVVERTSTSDPAGRDIKEYRFSRISPTAPHAPPIGNAIPPCSPISLGRAQTFLEVSLSGTGGGGDTVCRKSARARGVWGDMGGNGVGMGEDGGSLDPECPTSVASGLPTPTPQPQGMDREARLSASAPTSLADSALSATSPPASETAGLVDGDGRYIAENPARQPVIDLIEAVRQTDPECADDLKYDWMERLAIVAADEDCASEAERVAFEELQARAEGRLS